MEEKEYIPVFNCYDKWDQQICSVSRYAEVSEFQSGFSLPELTMEEVGMLTGATVLFLGTCWIFKKLGKAFFHMS